MKTLFDKAKFKTFFNKEHLPYTITQILSLLFLLPLTSIVIVVITLTYAFNSPKTIVEAEWILSTSWLESWSFIYITFILYIVVQSLMIPFYIYFHFINPTKFGTKYGSSLLLFCGFGTSQFILLKLSILKKRPKNKEQKNETERKKYWKHILLTEGAIIAILPIQFTFVGLTYNSDFVNPTHLQEIRLSTEPSKINVIEIFSDGIDEHVMGEMIKNHSDDFKDFKFYPNFATTGTNTLKSYNTLVGGFDASLLWGKGENLGWAKLDEVIPEHMGKIGLENKYSIDPKMDFLREGIIKGKNDAFEIKVGNWVQAQNRYSGAIGTTNSPEYSKYKMFTDLLTHAPHEEASHIMLHDMIYHFPYKTSPSGKLNFIAGTHESGAAALSNTLSMTIDGIKNFYEKDGKNPAYDNSLIIIYGDHASHSIPIEEYGKSSNDMKKSISLAAIKFPNASQNTPIVVNDRSFFSPLLNDVILDVVDKAKTFDWENNNDQPDWDELIRTDDRYKLNDRKFFLEREEGILVYEYGENGNFKTIDEYNNGWLTWHEVFSNPPQSFIEYTKTWYNNDGSKWSPSLTMGGDFND